MSRPASDSPAPVPTTVSQDLLAAALAALIPLGGGLTVILGYAWMGVFGAVLGLGATAAWIAWWHTKRGALFPKELEGARVGRVALLVLVIVLLFAAAAL